MKIVKINDNLKVNIELIYSLERNTNQYEINEWLKLRNDLVKSYMDNPPPVMIEQDRWIRPEEGMEISESDLKKYTEGLEEYIIEALGNKPQLIESYAIILATGLKVNISKDIYEKIDEYLNNLIYD